MKLFASKGYNTTSVQEIADECHMSRGAFYLYFKSKEALLISILHYYYDKVFTRIHEVQTEGGTQKKPTANSSLSITIIFCSKRILLKCS
ncbi:hypothetical protein BSAF29S_02811 [Bacillus safensis subsp. safensis]